MKWKNCFHVYCLSDFQIFYDQLRIIFKKTSGMTFKFQVCSFLPSASSSIISVLRTEFCSQWSVCIIYFWVMFSRMLSAAIFVSAELTRKAFTGFNRGRSYANTESLQKFFVTTVLAILVSFKKITTNHQ